jgi:hypothetical protein
LDAESGGRGREISDLKGEQVNWEEEGKEEERSSRTRRKYRVT